MRALALWGCVLALLVAYLAHSAARLERFLPLEQPLVEAIGARLWTAKPAYDGTLASVSRQDVLIVQVALFFAAATAVWALAIRAAFASGANPGRALIVILSFSALLRAEAVFVRPPLETDHYRYIWDGATTAEGLNPYEFSPSEVINYGRGKNRDMYSPERLARLERLSLLAARPELAGHFDRINHPKIPTLYPPTAQALFAVSYWIAPGSVTVLKALVALVDLGVVFLLAALLVGLGKDPRWVIGYGWCPLILKEYAGTGHFDPLAAGFTLAALLWVMRGRRMAAAVALGTAALAKLYPLLLVPILARRLGPAGVALLVATVLVGYGPFAAIGLHLFDGLFAFGSSWEFNSSLFTVFERALEPFFDSADPLMVSLALTRRASGDPVYLAEQTVDAFFAAKAVGGLIVLAAIALAGPWKSWSDEGLVARCGAVVAVLLAVSPVADPWYFGWLLPFACVFPSAAAAWLAWGMSFYYFYFLTWSYLWWTRPLEYVPAYGLLGWDLTRWLRGRKEDVSG